MPKSRRFPPPWTVEQANNACFIVKDANGIAVSYVYFEDEPRRREAANLMAQDEARRIAAGVARLPELLRKRLKALSRMIERFRSTPVLLIVTFRTEFAPPWVGQARVTSLTLNRLGGREVAAIVGHLVGNKQLAADVMAEIVERTDGATEPSARIDVSGRSSANRR